MHRFLYIPLIILLLSGCAGNDAPGEEPVSGIFLRIAPEGFGYTRIIDPDNLESEQTVKNLSVFFTEPSSDVVTHSWVYAGFSTQGDYRVVAVPLDASELQTRDIYVIANYDDEVTLEGITKALLPSPRSGN